MDGALSSRTAIVIDAGNCGLYNTYAHCVGDPSCVWVDNHCHIVSTTTTTTSAPTSATTKTTTTLPPLTLETTTTAGSTSSPCSVFAFQPYRNPNCYSITVCPIGAPQTALASTTSDAICDTGVARTAESVPDAKHVFVLVAALVSNIGDFAAHDMVLLLDALQSSLAKAWV